MDFRGEILFCIHGIRTLAHCNAKWPLVVPMISWDQRDCQPQQTLSTILNKAKTSFLKLRIRCAYVGEPVAQQALVKLWTIISIIPRKPIEVFTLTLVFNTAWWSRIRENRQNPMWKSRSRHSNCPPRWRQLRWRGKASWKLTVWCSIRSWEVWEGDFGCLWWWWGVRRWSTCKWR